MGYIMITQLNFTPAYSGPGNPQLTGLAWWKKTADADLPGNWHLIGPITVWASGGFLVDAIQVWVEDVPGGGSIVIRTKLDCRAEMHVSDPVSFPAPTTNVATTIANQAIVTLFYGLNGMPSASIQLTESGAGSMQNSPLAASESMRSNSTLLIPAGLTSFTLNCNFPESRTFTVRGYINGSIYFTNTYTGAGPSVFIIAQNIPAGATVYIDVQES